MRFMGEPRLASGFHPWHVVLITCAAPLFLGGALSDWAYANTYEIQWINFGSWLIAGAMVFTGLAVGWSLVEAAVGPGRSRRSLILLGLLGVMFVLGLLNSFMHARDAWASMPEGLILSFVGTALSVVAVYLSVSTSRVGVAP